MRVELENIEKPGGSCNFCNKGELKENGFGLKYPYSNVITFIRNGGNGLKASICEECLTELHIEAKALLTTI